MKLTYHIYIITFLAGLASLVVSVILLTSSAVTNVDYIIALMCFILFLILLSAAIVFHLIYRDDKELANDLGK